MPTTLLAADTLDSGATAWILASSALVLLMTPGLAFFYGGMARAKSVLNMMMMSFSAMGVVGVIYILWGYSMSFGDDLFGAGTAGIVGSPGTFFGLDGLFATEADPQGLAATWFLETASGGKIPALVGVAFQATFAIITVALISGAIADRMKFSTWLVFAGVWATFVYFPLAHMVWGGGFLSGADGGLAGILYGVTDGVANIFPKDFAGGTVVHINAGIAGLVLAVLLGKRKGFGKDPMKPHNVTYVMLGAGLLWFGWFGFNAGSAGDANYLAGLAWVNTLVATCAAMVGWLIIEKMRDGHATSLGAASGVVAGLVAITPAAGWLTPVGSLFLGVVAGALCALAVSLKYRFGYDDSLDVVGVHLVGGLVGTIGIGFLDSTTGLFYGGGADQLVVQTLVAVAAMVFAGFITLIIGLVLKATMGLRVDEETEIDGVDIAIHGETAYDLNASAGTSILSTGAHHAPTQSSTAAVKEEVTA